MALRRGVKHHRCRKGKWVRLKFRDGRVVDGRFDQSDDYRVRLMGGDEYPFRNMRSFRVLRPDERPR